MRLLAAIFLALSAALAQAQSYPAKPVRLIIPFPPGGSNDVVGRLIAAQLGERLGQGVIVDNRGGGGGTIGINAAAKSPADGYTLLFVSVGWPVSIALNAMPLESLQWFVPVAPVGTGPSLLVVPTSLPANSVRELIALAKAKPGELNAGAAGVGSFQHLATELFRLTAGIDIVIVQYKGGGPALTDTIAALPDVPTFAEAGLPGAEATNWWGIVAPAGTPAAMINRLQSEIAAIVESPETQKRFQLEGADVLRMTAEQFGKHLAAETDKWTRVVKQAGIKAD